MKGKSCSATCIANGLLCLVDLSDTVNQGLSQLARSRRTKADNAVKSNILEEKFNKGLDRFRGLIGKIKTKLSNRPKEQEPQVERSRAPEPMTIGKKEPKPERTKKQEALGRARSLLDALAKTKEEGQTLVRGSSNPSELKWSSLEGSGSRLAGYGKFGSFFTVPSAKLAKGENLPEFVGVKAGNIGQSEAFIAKKLGEAGIGPRLIAAKFINKPVSNADNGTVHKGVIAMEVVSGYPLYKIRDKTINGIHTTDAYWGARAKLHKMGIAHNDAHGGNVIIDDKGTARFVDLGLAKKGWRAALSEALGGHTGADHALDTYPRWNQMKVMDRNYEAVKSLLRENKFSDREIEEMSTFGIQRSDSEFKASPFSRVSVPLAKQLIATLYEGIG